MKKISLWFWVWVLFVLGLFVLDHLNLISDIQDIAWGLIFGLTSIRLFTYLVSQRENSWLAFFSMTMLGLTIMYFYSESFAKEYGSLILFFFISLSFGWIFLFNKNRVWAIFISCMMITFGILSVLKSTSGIQNIFLLFIGLVISLCLTFLLHRRTNLHNSRSNDEKIA